LKYGESSSNGLGGRYMFHMLGSLFQVISIIDARSPVSVLTNGPVSSKTVFTVIDSRDNMCQPGKLQSEYCLQGRT
jgi:hypothetical protein